NMSGCRDNERSCDRDPVFTFRICRSLKPPGSCKIGSVLLLRPRVRALAVLLAVVHVGAARAGALALGFLGRFLLALLRLLRLLGGLLRYLDNGVVKARARARRQSGCLQLRQRREGDGDRQGQDGDKGLADAHSKYLPFL